MDVELAQLGDDSVRRFAHDVRGDHVAGWLRGPSRHVGDQRHRRIGDECRDDDLGTIRRNDESHVEHPLTSEAERRPAPTSDVDLPTSAPAATAGFVG